MFLSEDGRRRSLRSRGWAEIERLENEKLTRRVSIHQLPPELLQKIFSYLKFEDVSQIRSVCQCFNASCQTMLKLGIKSHIKKIDTFLRTNQLALPLEPTLREEHPLHETRLTVKKMLYYLDVLDETYRNNNYFFIAGEVLDESERILNIFAMESCTDLTDELEDFFDMVVLAKRHFLVEVTPKSVMNDWSKLSRVTVSTVIQHQKERLFLLEKKQFDRKVEAMEKTLERQRKVFQRQKTTIETLRKNYLLQQRQLKKLENDVRNKDQLLIDQGKLIHSNEKAQEKKIAALGKVISSLETKFLKESSAGSNKKEGSKKDICEIKPKTKVIRKRKTN